MCGLPDNSAIFYARIQDALHAAGPDGLSMKRMCELSELTYPAAAHHVQVLTRKRVIERLHYRAWGINNGWMSDYSRMLMADAVAARDEHLRQQSI